MSISGINSSNQSVGSSHTSSMKSLIQDVDGDKLDLKSSSGSQGRGGFASAIDQALSELGVSSAGSKPTNSSTTDPSSNQDPQQALASFMQNLLSALHGSASSQSGIGKNVDDDNETSIKSTGGVSHGGRHSHGMGASKVEQNLQSLIQQLNTSNASNSNSTSTTSGTLQPSANSSGVLQQSFSDLLNANGIAGNHSSLSNFLQTLSKDLQGATASGNIISTNA